MESAYIKSAYSKQGSVFFSSSLFLLIHPVPQPIIIAPTFLSHFDASQYLSQTLFYKGSREHLNYSAFITVDCTTKSQKYDKVTCFRGEEGVTDLNMGPE